MQLLFGTRTSGEINLVAQLLMIGALWVGFYFAHTHQIPKHRNVQTTVVLANIFFIALVMITSFYSYVILGGTTGGTIAVLMMIHGTLGLIAELTGIYLVLRMRTQLIPPRFRVRNFKLVMRSLLGLWTAIVLLGLGIFYFRYLAAPATTAATPIVEVQVEADAIALHAEELQAAVQRGNLPTAKRHAEHVVNLIEGKTGADYGDLDKDGLVEDPGDGVGALVYLAKARGDAGQAGGSGAQAAAVADQVQAAMIKIVADSKSVLLAGDVNAVAAPAAELGTLADQINKGTSNSVPQMAQLLGVSAAPPAQAPASASVAPNTTTVHMVDFQFQPKTLTVKKGTTVVFVNLDTAKHTVTEDDGKFNSKDVLPGESFSFTFNETGTFPYHCEFHGDRGGVDMAGTVVVQ
jgi:plastocyanin